ncbi:glutamine synthetase family protein [Rhodococcus opacus]|uniref:glutamine synthetase family protein n=1 Tax=Rhodococcus opacus TaxID=37919 RepID=UPI001C446102|nr:glutamine synthetase family protein [Rhodococcus opacus]MBV6755484.1 glutamine synthetase family protein [Rhodococcus opacus]
MASTAESNDQQRLRDFVEANGIHTFKIGAVDLDGLWRGKRISAEYFVDSVHRDGTNICNILFGWDMQDEMISDLTYTGWHTGYPDINLRPDLSTLAVVPWEPGTASVICDIFERDGRPLELSPRTVLKSMIARSESLGYQPIFAYEFEFYLFRGTPREIAARHWRDLETFTEGHHTYSVYRDTGSEFVIGELRRQLADYGISIEASNSEHGPGQFEVNIHYSDALKAADSAMLLKHAVKELAARHGLTASFMAKVNPDWAGSSGHVHQSLLDKDGAAVFANPTNPGTLSDIGSRYLAGLVDHAADLTAIYLPIINSYKRTEGGTWAGSSSTWGLDNRTVAIRSIPSAGPAARVENRIGGADANPYLVVAANLAAGLDGIEQNITLPPAVEGNAYALPAGKAPLLPTSLPAAVDRFNASIFARKFLGDRFVDHFTATRRWEIKQFGAAITEWEIARYLEQI